MGRAGESLFQGKEAELCRTTQIRGGRRPAARVLGTRVRTPNLRAWGYAQVLCWTLLSITYSLGLWLREKNWGHCTPPPHQSWRCLSCPLCISVFRVTHPLQKTSAELAHRGLSDENEGSGWCEPRFLFFFLTGYTKNVVQKLARKTWLI